MSKLPIWIKVILLNIICFIVFSFLCYCLEIDLSKSMDSKTYYIPPKIINN